MSMKADCMPGRMRTTLAEVDVADDAAAGVALDMQLLHDALVHDGDAGFLRREVDQDLFGMALESGIGLNGLKFRGCRILPFHRISLRIPLYRFCNPIFP
jgi:hypothetical protein